MQCCQTCAATALAGTGILRVVIEDASGLGFPKANAETFPAHGNHHGKTAGVKIDLAYDLLSQTIISHSLEAATTQDKTIGKEVIVEVGPVALDGRFAGLIATAFTTVYDADGARVIEHGDCADLDQSITVDQTPEPPTEPSTEPPNGPTTEPPVEPQAVSTPPETAPPVTHLPRAGDGSGRVLADLGSIVFVIGVGLLCLAWWRRPDDDIRPILDP